MRLRITVIFHRLHLFLPPVRSAVAAPEDRCNGSTIVFVLFFMTIVAYHMDARQHRKRPTLLPKAKKNKTKTKKVWWDVFDEISKIDFFFMFVFRPKNKTKQNKKQQCGGIDGRSYDMRVFFSFSCSYLDLILVYPPVRVSQMARCIVGCRGSFCFLF